MFNTFPFNQVVYGSLGSYVLASSQTPIVFNGYSLQNDSISSSVLIDSMPGRDFPTFAVPRGDGEVAIGDFWRRKLITVRGMIRKTTAQALEDELDAMKKALAVGESTLDIKHPTNVDGTIRRFVATLINGDQIFSQRRNYHVTVCPFEAQFVTLEPFGHSVDYSATTWADQTSLSFSDQVENLGTVRAKPVVIVNFTAATSITALSFTNNTTGERITVTRSFSASDYLSINFETMEVTVNGTAVDFTGTFPKLDTGVNSFTLALTGTSALYTLTVKHKTPYL